jgi:hypothetical protein
VQRGTGIESDVQQGDDGGHQKSQNGQYGGFGKQGSGFYQAGEHLAICVCSALDLRIVVLHGEQTMRIEC